MSLTAKSLAVLAAAAMLSTNAAAGVAQAAKPASKVGATTLTARIQHQANVAREMQAGSAGIPGYDNKRCEQLLQDLNNALDRAIEASEAGDSKTGSRYSNLANHMEQQLTDNCLVVY
jgi:hypothetical protein